MIGTYVTSGGLSNLRRSARVLAIEPGPEAWVGVLRSACLSRETLRDWRVKAEAFAARYLGNGVSGARLDISR